MNRLFARINFVLETTVSVGRCSLALDSVFQAVTGRDRASASRMRAVHSTQPPAVAVHNKGVAMAEGDVIKLLTSDVTCEQIVRLIDIEWASVIQILIPGGQKIPTHEAQREAIFHCLYGHVTLSALGIHRELREGELLYLAINEPYSIHAHEAASLLITIIAAKEGSSPPLIGG